MTPRPRIALILLVVAAAACTRPAAPPPSPPGASFCERAAEVLRLNVADEHEYPRIVAAYESVIAVAPPDLVPDLTTLANHFRAGSGAVADADLPKARERIGQKWRTSCA